MKVTPLGSRILVEAKTKDEEVKGGIVIPDTAQKKANEGVVIAVGAGGLDSDGKRIPSEIKVGDTILMPKYGGTDIKVDGKEYLLVNESDVLAKV